MKSLLDLPLELQERIMCYVLRPSYILEHGEAPRYSNNKEYIMRNPLKTLLLRRRSADICRELYCIALPAYFRSTTLNIVVGEWTAPLMSRYGPTALVVRRGIQVLFGTFREAPLFFENTRKLRVEITRMCGIRKVCEILSKCSKLVEVSVCTQNLEAEEGKRFLARVLDAMDQTKTDAACTRIKVREETAAEYAREISIRNLAGKELEYQESRWRDRHGFPRRYLLGWKEGELPPWFTNSQRSYDSIATQKLPSLMPHQEPEPRSDIHGIMET